MSILSEAMEPIHGRRGVDIDYQKDKNRVAVSAAGVRDFWFVTYRTDRRKAWRVALASPPGHLWGGCEKVHRKCHFSTAKEAIEFLLGELRGEGL
jgi:hypothetical protein